MEKARPFRRRSPRLRHALGSRRHRRAGSPELHRTTTTSATRLAAPILDTPRSVSVVTPQLIQDRAIVDPQEAVQNVAGVQRSGGRTGTDTSYLLRGFAQQSLFKDGFRAGDGAGFAVFTFEAPTDVANLERIEVLKGPEAILYGRGEPGGVVNYLTHTPAFENRFSLQQMAGSDDFYRTQINANWNAMPGRLALRLDAAYERNESFIDFVEGERWFVAPAFKWQIGADTTLTFRGEASSDDRSTSLGLPFIDGRVLPGVPYHRYFGEGDDTKLQAETQRGLLELEHRWNESHRTAASLHGVNTEADGLNLLLFNFAGPTQDPVTGEINRIAEQIRAGGEYFTARLDHTWDWTIYEAGASTAALAASGAAILVWTGFSPAWSRFALRARGRVTTPAEESEAAVAERQPTAF